MYLDRLAALVRDGLLDAGVDRRHVREVRIDRSVRSAHGDFGTPSALRFARSLGWTPLDLASRLADRLSASAEVEQAQVAPPGFVNVRLTPRALAGIASETLAVEKGLVVPPHPTPIEGRVEALYAAHARATDVVRWAGSFGMDPSAEAPVVLTPEPERALVCALAELAVVLGSGRGSRLADKRLLDVADLLWRSGVDYDVLPSGDAEPTPEHRTRLLLVDATRAALAAGLNAPGALGSPAGR